MCTQPCVLFEIPRHEEAREDVIAGLIGVCSATSSLCSPMYYYHQPSSHASTLTCHTSTGTCLSNQLIDSIRPMDPPQRPPLCACGKRQENMRTQQCRTCSTITRWGSTRGDTPRRRRGRRSIEGPEDSQIEEDDKQNILLTIHLVI